LHSKSREQESGLRRSAAEGKSRKAAKNKGDVTLYKGNFDL
jgi:hypothetical protein